MAEHQKQTTTKAHGPKVNNNGKEADSKTTRKPLKIDHCTFTKPWSTTNQLGITCISCP